MAKEVIKIPDLGGASDVEVVELSVAAGDLVEVDDVLVVLETDKASMEIPSPAAGRIASLDLAEGDTVSEGTVIGQIETVEAIAQPAADESGLGEAGSAAPAALESEAEEPVTGASSVQEVVAPDLGGAGEVEVIELVVAAGDQVAEGATIVVLESDKASMEVPSPLAGRVVELKLALGDTISEGDLILTLEPAEAIAPLAEAAAERQEAPPVQPPETVAPSKATPDTVVAGSRGAQVHAGPAVRKLAREFGVDLSKISGSGPSNRILKDDVQAYVKQRLQQTPSPLGGSSGAGIPPIPEVDFSQFGPVRVEAMSKTHRITAENMHRSWLNVPRVTQFDEADISDLEQFRADLKPEAAARGLKLTPMPFLLKACALTLVNNPAFNASLHPDGEQIIYKDYVHIGMAVATPAGLMVPVVRDVDTKSIYELAAESVELAAKAKERKLKPQEMQGGCFTISSLGGIGGTGFTPVVNAPEVAILGVSKMSVKPVWNGSDFEPRKMLPLALAYDHRAVNGADAGKFMTELVGLLSDIRRLTL